MESRLVSANTKTFGSSLDSILSSVKHAGYNAIEIWDEDLLEDYQSKVALVKSSGLDVSAFQLLRDYEGSRDVEKSLKLCEAERLMAIMTDIGADTLLLCANTQKGSSNDSDTQVSDLRELARMASARQLRIGFEPLAWSAWIDNYEVAIECVRQVNHHSFGLVLDVFHWFAKKTPLQLVNEVDVEKLFLIQLSNVGDLDSPLIDIARHHRRFPSDGVWPIDEMVRAIERLGYEGYYSLEVFNDDYKIRNVDEVAALGMRSFKTIS